MAKKEKKTVDLDKISNSDIERNDDQDVINTIENDILSLAAAFVQNLPRPEKMEENNGLFVGMLKRLYQVYVKDLIKNSLVNNNNKYDISLLNELFNVYTTLVYSYKQSTQPNILEFCIFCHINPNLINNIRYGILDSRLYNNNNYVGSIDIKALSPEDIDNVKMWFIECENGLVNGKTVFDIFKLKSMYGYNDNLAAVPVEMQSGLLTAAELPDLSRLHKSRISDNAINDQGENT